MLRDPFGLAQRVLAGAHADEVMVLPRVLPVRATAGGGDGVSAHARAALVAAAETEIDGLREHREGSPASRIHWPTLARGAGLMERKLISEADSRPLVVLDPRAPASQDALDASVRAAASLAVHFARKTGCGLLLPGDRRAVTIDPDLLAWPQAHVRLALIDAATGPALTAAQNRRGLVVFVAARVIDRPPRGLGPHAGRLPDRGAGSDRGPPQRAGGGRLPGLRGRPDRQRGGDGRRGGRGVSTLAAPRPGPVVREAAAGGALLPLVVRARRRAGRVRRVRRVCTGPGCSSRPSRAGRGRPSASPRSSRSRCSRAARLRAPAVLGRWPPSSRWPRSGSRCSRAAWRTSTSGRTAGASCCRARAAASRRSPACACRIAAWTSGRAW